MHTVVDNKTEYGEMLSEINGKEIKFLMGTFAKCTNMIKAPKISSNAEYLTGIFANCESLTDISNVNINEKITDVNYMFAYCTSLNSYPDFSKYTKEKMIGVFYECTGITSFNGLTIPNSITSIDILFCGCTGITNFNGLTIPSSVTVMTGTFANCTGIVNLEGLTIPSSVTRLGGGMFEDGCFAGCTNLVDATAINIPDNVASIGKMFKDCSKLTKVPEIPVKQFENSDDCVYIFENTSALKEITFKGTKAQWKYEISESDLTGKTIHCTDGDLTY